MRGVSTITLGYTFFRSANPANAKDMSRFLADAAPGIRRAAAPCSASAAAPATPSIAT